MIEEWKHDSTLLECKQKRLAVLSNIKENGIVPKGRLMQEHGLHMCISAW